jgi:hypothetical protein
MTIGKWIMANFPYQAMWPYNQVFASIFARLDALEAFRTLQRREAVMADKTMDDVLADITELRTKEEGLAAVTNHLQEELTAALSGMVIPPEVQAKINAAFDAVEANKAEVVAAIDANTPPSNTPPIT